MRVHLRRLQGWSAAAMDRFFGKGDLIPNLYSTFSLQGRMDRETKVTIPNLYSIFFLNYCMDCES
jgi:hypothetical protein